MFSLADDAQYEAIIKRSRFIARATAVSHADDAPACLERIRDDLLIGRSA